MRKLVTLGVMALAFPASAVAHAESASQTVTAAASKLPEPNTRLQATINQKALKRLVAKAVRAGEARRLWDSTTDPDIHFDLLLYAKIESKREADGGKHKKPKKPEDGVTGEAPISSGSEPEAITDKLVAPLMSGRSSLLLTRQDAGGRGQRIRTTCTGLVK